jgi:predicted nucleic acid-binding Zn ribbon protein
MRDDWKRNQQRMMAAILPGVMRDRGWQAQIEQHSIFPNWSKVVDETTAAHAEPLKIVKGTLWVEVENSAWMQQFQFQKLFLLETINNFLKNATITDIRFVLPKAEKKMKKDEQKVRFAAPPADDVKHFEEQASFIEDEATREALIRFWYLSKACVRD